MNRGQGASPRFEEPDALKTSGESARKLLDECINRGRQLIAQPPQSEGQLDGASDLERKWQDYAKQALTSLFTTNATAVEFANAYSGPSFVNPSLGQEVDVLLRRVRARVNCLESIRDRLDLIPVLASATAHVPRESVSGRKVFLVHGHNEQLLREVELFLRRGGIEPVVLRQQPNQGRTIIEKFEQHADDVGFAVVLLTGDDMGYCKPKGAVKSMIKLYGTPRPRARQNVILELGFFLGALRRKRVCALYEQGVEIPSDYVGVAFVPLHENWKAELGRELEAAGIRFDLGAALAP